MITQLDWLSCVLKPVSKAGRLSVTAAHHSRDLEPKLRESRTTPLDVTVESLISRIVICRSEEHTSELQSHLNIVCRLLLEKKKHKVHSMEKNTDMMRTILRNK